MSNTNIVTVDGFEFQYRDDEYINLTKMCKQTGRKFNHYFRTQPTKEFLEALSNETNISVADLVQKKVGGVSSEQGTYGHPLVAIHLSQWCSPEAALAVAKLTQSYLKADISLAKDILSRNDNLNSEDSRELSSQVIDKSSEEDRDWMEARLKSKNSNKALNSELKKCPNTSRAVYSKSQDAMVTALTGNSTKVIKALNNLPDHASAREVMSTDELISLSFTEMLAMKRIVNVRPVGDNQCAEVCGTAGKMVKEFSDNFVNA